MVCIRAPPVGLEAGAWIPQYAREATHCPSPVEYPAYWGDSFTPRLSDRIIQGPVGLVTAVQLFLSSIQPVRAVGNSTDGGG